MVEKLINMKVPGVFSLFIFLFLETRTQFVKLNSTINSEKMTTNTGSPQGTVSSPFLFSIYTGDYRPQHSSCQVVKFADDTALIERDDDSHYRKEIQYFEYCDSHFLELNVKKTRTNDLQ